MCAVDVAQKRWKTLQDKFARELKKIKKSGDPVDLSPTWELLDHLMFLKEFIKHRKYVLFIIAHYYYFTIIHVHVLHYSFYRTVGNLDTPIESEYQNNDEGTALSILAVTLWTRVSLPPLHQLKLRRRQLNDRKGTHIHVYYVCETILGITCLLYVPRIKSGEEEAMCIR